jgi:hypothetical protein
MREIFSEAPAPGTLLTAAVGLRAAPMEVSLVWEAVQRRPDGSGLLYMYVVGEKFSVILWAVPLDRLGVLSRV